MGFCSILDIFTESDKIEEHKMINEELFKTVCRSYNANCKFDKVNKKGKYPTVYTIIDCKHDRRAMLCHLDCAVIAVDDAGKQYPMVFP